MVYYQSCRREDRERERVNVGRAKKLKKLSKKYLTSEKLDDIIVRLSQRELLERSKFVKADKQEILENRTTELRKKNDFKWSFSKEKRKTKYDLVNSEIE